ncbi:MAG TPA: pyruvate ferredoxin oxidoreductase [Methanomassiliicoccales archaeon]|nr:pyruvate ferredoxin oxidoreductase [Methanomassiliicoccales archaeon]
MKVRVISADHAVAYAAKLARIEVIPSFPITPQTLIVEQLAEFISNGELDADFIPADSEHSVMSIAIGASAGGVRVFTATSSQGLALMHEMLYCVPQNRLPIVMVNVNRSLGAASGIWVEYNDSMAERDSGWLQMYVEDNQEALDATIMAFRLAEDRRSLLPVMICLDGFILSHTVEKVELPEQEEVDDFLPKYDPLNILDPADPKVINPIVPPEYAMEMRYQLDRAIEHSREIIMEVDKEFAKVFGRSYGGLIDTYRMEDAEFAMLTLGTATGLARRTVDEMRAEGKKAGLIKLRFMRPFPFKELCEATKGLRSLGVFDRSVSFNGGGPVHTEVAAALCNVPVTVTGHIAGIGGRDITPRHMRDMYDLVEKAARGEDVRKVTWHGLRGDME